MVQACRTAPRAQRFMAINFARSMLWARPRASAVNPAALQTAAEASDGMNAVEAATKISAASIRFILASQLEIPQPVNEAPFGESSNLEVGLAVLARALLWTMLFSSVRGSAVQLGAIPISASGPAGNQGTGMQQAPELAFAQRDQPCMHDAQRAPVALSPKSVGAADPGRSFRRGQHEQGGKQDSQGKRTSHHLLPSSSWD